MDSGYSNSQGAGWLPADTADFDHGSGMERVLYGDYDGFRVFIR